MYRTCTGQRGSTNKPLVSRRRQASTTARRRCGARGSWPPPPTAPAHAPSHILPQPAPGLPTPRPRAPRSRQPARPAPARPACATPVPRRRWEPQAVAPPTPRSPRRRGGPLQARARRRHGRARRRCRRGAALPSSRRAMIPSAGRCCRSPAIRSAGPGSAAGCTSPRRAAGRGLRRSLGRRVPALL